MSIKNSKGEYYLFCWDHNADLLYCFCKLFGFDDSIVVQIEVLEGPHEDLLLALVAGCFLRHFLQQLFFKAKRYMVKDPSQVTKSSSASTYLSFKDSMCYFDLCSNIIKLLIEATLQSKQFRLLLGKRLELRSRNFLN